MCEGSSFLSLTWQAFWCSCAIKWFIYKAFMKLRSLKANQVKKKNKLPFYNAHYYLIVLFKSHLLKPCQVALLVDEFDTPKIFLRYSCAKYLWLISNLNQVRIILMIKMSDWPSRNSLDLNINTYLFV